MADYTRRTVLGVTGASVATIATAGCLGSDDAEAFEIDPETTIVIEGYNSHWEGVEPEEIEGSENPTFVLEEDERYEIEWINGDGMEHDLQLWDDGDAIVDDLATDTMADEGERDVLEFTATAELSSYVCSLHARRQIGEFDVE
ncbi:hypothetical protein SAMN04487967_0279 [Natronorubrum sediminis]|uniref:Copper binding protein, plastocyanin/azurin family n=1 Tax=Natronorubrum sediminis TaxID=640943 RepID=A0A1H6FM51_9EURY|nr:PKD domain-containing protein [Natronorubrum sediminis]SEH11280.1 hypothetical protein SAMN04487967_0279 [Natronorubrum sediminis]